MTAFHFPESLPVGAVLDAQVHIGGVLGSGGMADVYAGRKLDLDIPVAVKVLKPVLDPEARRRFQQRFLKEARVAARINHPNVVRILSFHAEMRLRLPDGREAAFERPYLVMEHLDGEDLDQALALSGPLAPERAWTLTLGVLAGLARGHELGIVHKDIKPHNLFLVGARGRDSEALRVLDFGIARAADDPSQLTQTGETWCTPNYAAPEYIEDHTVSPPLDVYQVGLVLAEMLTGAPVVTADTPFKCFQAHTRGVTLPEALVASPFEAVLRRALAKRPEDRYRDAGAFYDAVAALDADAVRAMPTLERPPSAGASAELETLDTRQAGSDAALDTVASAPVATSETVAAPATGPAPAPAPALETTPASADSPVAPPAPAPASGAAIGLATWVGVGAVVAGVVALVALRAPGDDGGGAAVAVAPVSTSADAGGRAALEAVAPAPSVAKTPTTTACGPGETTVGRLCVPAGMALISAGSTWLGCDRGDNTCAEDEKPGREVALSAYFLDRTEVTVAAYRRCVTSGRCEAPAKGSGQHYTWAATNSDALPINGVTWRQARAFCSAAGKRLPSEAEWEAAARSNGSHRYPWGGEPPDHQRVPIANLADEAAHRAFGWPAYVAGYDDGHAGPCAVDALPPTATGLYGLGGNVAEWVEDCYQRDAYAKLPARDPVAGAEPCRERVVRGSYFGSYSVVAMRSAARRHAAVEHARYDTGFRCAKSLP